MSAVQQVKNFQKSVFEKFKINAALFVQALIYSGMLMVGTIIGFIMREAEVQGFTTFFLVAIINVALTIFMFKGLKLALKDLWPTPEDTKQGKKKKKGTQGTYSTPSDL